MSNIAKAQLLFEPTYYELWNSETNVTEQLITISPYNRICAMPFLTANGYRLNPTELTPDTFVKVIIPFGWDSI